MFGFSFFWFFAGGFGGALVVDWGDFWVVGWYCWILVFFFGFFTFWAYWALRARIRGNLHLFIEGIRLYRRTFFDGVKDF